MLEASTIMFLINLDFKTTCGMSYIMKCKIKMMEECDK